MARTAWRQRWLVIKGFAVLHLKRSSPVFVIMTVVFGDRIGGAEWKVGWWFYGLAIGQYLIIALITDRDRVEGMLAVFTKRADDIRSDISDGRPQRRD